MTTEKKIRAKGSGSVYESRGHWFARVSIGGGVQRSELLPHATNEDEALERTAVIAGLVAKLRAAGDVFAPVIEKTITQAAAASDERLVKIIASIDDATAGRGGIRVQNPAPSRDALTFKAVGEAWTSGDLARRFPDYVKRKRSSDGDAYTLEIVYAAPVANGRKFGELYLADIRIEHVDAVMATLPTTLQPATRRQYVQAIRKVLGYGVHPLRQITSNPVAREHMPKGRRSLAKGQLRPAEEARVCLCTKIPILDRLVLGFCHREGMRTGEAVAIEWSDVDLELGTVTLDENKTDEPRAWVLGADVLRTLVTWRARNPDARYVFGGDEPHNVHKLADRFRRYLGETYANVQRPELLERTGSRIPLRAHDARGAFITRALACDRTEAWVTDRTGHKSSQMVYGYKQTARTEAALGLGWWAPLDEVTPDVAAKLAADPDEAGEEAGPSPRNHKQSRSGKSNRGRKINANP